MFWDILLDTALDCLKMLPFLLVAYFLIEFIERNASEKLENVLSRGGRFGFIPAAVLGLIPQCGFSGFAANLYNSNVITVGTLIAVFLSTSDEAIPLLVASPEKWKEMLFLLGAKFCCALIGGFLCDFVLKIKGGYTGSLHEIDCNDHDEKESLLGSTLRHTGIIMLYLFATLLIINLVVEWIGSDRLAALIEKAGIFQIFICGLIGMIPNCAASVLLTQMFVSGHLSFSAMFAGLCSGSGIGTLVLLKSAKDKHHVIRVLALLYAFGILFGLLISLIH